MHRSLAATVLAASVTLLAGCVTGSQARSVKTSAFLGDARPLLHAGQPGDPLLVYRNPNAQWTRYKSIELDSVGIWSDPSRNLTAEERDDLQKLVDSFTVTLYKKLSTSYAMVDHGGPGVMRMQIAITDGQRGATQLKVATIAVPYWIGASLLWRFATGKPPFVGEASIEYKFTDGETGELLAAGADRRVGADTLVASGGLNRDYFNSWGDVKYSLEYWAADTVYRLCMLRGDTSCVKP